MAKQHSSKGQTQRQLRVGEAIRHAFAEILMRAEIVDPEFDGAGVVVTEVRVSPDMRNATIYAMPFADGDPKVLKAGLIRHQRFLRGELAKRVDLKYMPQLSFEIDDSFEKAGRIEEILRSPAVKRDLD